jgi:glycosyltransferase involved in cell wall biosynthesis
VIIPAFNEEKTIGPVIEETIRTMDSLQLPYEIIVVDDGSTDGTAKVASGYKATVLSNGRNRGKGYAVRKGFDHAQGGIIVTIDSDGAHNPKEIPELVIPLLNGTDIVAGSRFLWKRGYTTTRLNRFGNFLFNLAIIVLTRKHITDSQTGFRALKSEIVGRLRLGSMGYDIETEITIKGLKNGFRFEERPITCSRREYSSSRLKVLQDGAKIIRAIMKASFAEIEPGDHGDLAEDTGLSFRARSPQSVFS